MLQKQELLKDIESSRKKITDYADNITSTTLKLSASQRQITLKNEILNKRKKELKLNKKIIKSFQLKIDSLHLSLQNLQTDFKVRANGLYVHTLKNKGKLNLNSLAINKSILKKIYSSQYNKICHNLADSINSNVAILDSSKIEQQLVVDENRAALIAIEKEKEKYSLEHDAFKSSIKKMKSKKSSLKKDLSKYNKALKSLEGTISKAIKNSKKTKIDIKLSDDFASNEGIFNTPLKSGLIISNFGEQPHPVISNVKIFNNGVDIASLGGDEVKAIFTGQVISIQEIPASGKAIIIQHGEYYSVYSKLIKTTVKIGDMVQTQEHIGNISTLAGENILHFELWKNQSRMDPEKWIQF